MKFLYIDAAAGAAGDMLTAALLGLMDNEETALKMLNDVGLKGVEWKLEKVKRAGIEANHVKVLVHGTEEGHEHHAHHEEDDCHEHHHHHTTLAEVHEIIDSLKLTDSVKKNAKSVYDLIADAESKAHGVTVGEVHFHEVGMMDAIADVVAVCLLMEELSVDKVVVSPINVGFGKVKCAHGIMSVPAPATANLLAGIPVYPGETESEMCTPTGAALLKFFGTYFGKMPGMTLKKTSHGAGNKDFEGFANVVTLRLGENSFYAENPKEVVELSANVDDMTGEEVAFAVEKLMEAGALDVSVENVLMKKGRPGMLFRVICTESLKEKLAECIFKYTTTIGIRETLCGRMILERKIKEYDTVLGKVRTKKVTGYGTEREKFEFDDLKALANEHDMSLKEIKEIIGAEIEG
ncbi:MAG: nickel pincer cofactor biosynthesis protein LarC [Bacteroidaceae bacterium]|nr:nickel pincer cofactor biosynthesis protein LarC [Bacteroidaceae bacterium]